MTDIKISALPASTAPVAASIIPMVVAGTTSGVAMGTLVSQPKNRVVSGTTDTVVAADLDGVTTISTVGICTVTLPSLAASLVSGRTLKLRWITEDPSALVYFATSGTTVNGSSSTIVVASGVRQIEATSRDGVAWFVVATRTPGWAFVEEEFQQTTARTISNSTGVSNAAIADVAAHVGIVASSSGTVITNKSAYTIFGDAAHTQIKAGLVVEFIARVRTLDAVAGDTVVQLGHNSNLTYATTRQTIRFEYLSGTSANWRGICGDGTQTVASGGTNVAVTTNWVRLKYVINAAGTSVAFYVDGVLIGTAAANIPTDANFQGPYISRETLAAGPITAIFLDLDYASMEWPVTR